MKRIQDTDIIFDEDVFEDDGKLYVYLWETDILDKITGLYTNVLHNDHFNINYYGVYDLNRKSFNVEVNITLYTSVDEIYKLFPQITTTLEEYMRQDCKNNDYYIDLYNKEKEMIFEKFKKYCILDYKDVYPQIETFEQLEKILRKELGL